MQDFRPLRNSSRIPTLDGWRGIAILLVIFQHVLYRAGRGSQVIAMIGTVGVTIFFVLSGFLITTKLMQERQETGGISLRSFYIRRFFRLMPAAWALLLVVSVVSGFLHTISYNFMTNLLGCVFFFYNYLNRPAVFVSHFWTLSIEEQFYLVWPTLLFLLGPRRGGYFALTVAGAISIHRMTRWAYLAHAPWERTIHSELRVDALCVGCLAALILPRLRPYLRQWHIWPLLGVLAAYVFSMGHLAPLGFSCATALALCVTSKFPSSIVSRCLECRFLTVCGTYSYSLYLWNVPVVLTISTSTLAGVSRSIAITALLAWISYEYIERPGIRIGTRIAQRIKKKEAVEELALHDKERCR
jgi:peptidoglycan/LPS O-acetylase OafA/YrhL